MVINVQINAGFFTLARLESQSFLIPKNVYWYTGDGSLKVSSVQISSILTPGEVVNPGVCGPTFSNTQQRETRTSWCSGTPLKVLTQF